jgi:hypothetical protein
MITVTTIRIAAIVVEILCITTLGLLIRKIIKQTREKND